MFTEEFKENIFYFNKPAESKKIVTQEEVCQMDGTRCSILYEH